MFVYQPYGIQHETLKVSVSGRDFARMGDMNSGGGGRETCEATHAD